MLKFLCITSLLLVCFASILAGVSLQALVPNCQELTEIVTAFRRKTLEIRLLWRRYAWIWPGQLIQRYARLIQALYRPLALQPVALPRQRRRRPPAAPCFVKKA